jgi:hypothetical protein
LPVDADRRAADEAWRGLRRNSRILWYLLFASLPATALLSWLLGSAVKPSLLWPLLTFAFVAAIGVAGLRMASFVCPGCGQRYFEKWYFFKPLSSECMHCGLKRRSGVPEGPAGKPV